MIDYHDNEWGQPQKNSTKLFELLMLEGMQAGLSWLTILKKRAALREAFAQFDPVKLSQFTENDVQHLLNNAGIIRHQKKIEAVIHNANIFLDMQKQSIDFADWCWQWVNHQPTLNFFKSLQDIPAQTDLSQQISKALKKLGFKFVGPTTVYAFMQSAGMVNDHTQECFLYCDD
jgi:DNA-3-methyladenine glycosylase I